MVKGLAAGLAQAAQITGLLERGFQFLHWIRGRRRVRRSLFRDGVVHGMILLILPHPGKVGRGQSSGTHGGIKSHSSIGVVGWRCLLIERNARDRQVVRTSEVTGGRRKGRDTVDGILT